MANDINIDSLSIEIKSESEKAVSALNALSDMFVKLGESIAKVKGMSRVTAQIEKLADVAQKANFSNLEKMTSSLERLSKLTMPNFTKTANSLAKMNKSISEIGAIGDLSDFSMKINNITDAVRPMESLGKNSLAPFISSLKAIPKLTSSFDNDTLQRFKELVDKTVIAITPLTDKVEKSEKGLVALNGILKRTVSSNGNLASSNAALVKSYTSLGRILTSVKAKIIGAVWIGKRLGSVFSSAFASSNSYVENLNLFTVAMGDAADEAFRFAQEVQNALGIDASEWIRSQGVFRSILSGFGTVSDKATLMSKNLTQIGYDISSFFNINIDDAMQKVQSGISGELEPLRRLGYALDAATLQQIAYNNGISQNINTMTQAQKSQLRYVAILQQSANVMGDMARTITTPANSMRVLNQQMEQLKRAFGNIFSVLAVKIIPYIQVFIRLLTEAANHLAQLWGFKLPEIDYSNVGEGLTGVADDADEATDAVKDTIKAVQRLAGFDEINVLKSAKEDADDTAAALSNQFDLGINLPEYDFLQGVENSTEELYQKVKAWLKEIYEWWKKHRNIIKLIAKLLATMWAIDKVKRFVSYLGTLLTPLKKIFNAIKDGNKTVTSYISNIGSLAGTAVSAIGGYDLVSGLVKGTNDIKDNIADIMMIGGGIGLATVFGGPAAGAVAALSAAIAGLVGGIKACKDAADEAEKALERLLNAEWYTGGTKITEATSIIDEYLTKLSAPENALLNSTKETDTLKKNIEDISRSIDVMFASLGDADSVDISAVEKIKNAFDDLASTTNSYIKQNSDTLKTYIISNQGLLDQIGINVNTVMGFIDSAAGNTLNKIEDIQSQIDALTSKSTLSDADTKKLQDLQKQLLEISGVKYDAQTEEINKIKQSIESLASIRINPTNIDTAYNELTNISKKYGETLKTLEDARKEALNKAQLLTYDSDEQKQAVINAINSVYDIKKSDLGKAYNSIENIAGQIKNVFSEMYADINNYTVPDFEFSFLFDEWFGSDSSWDEAQRRKAQEQINELKKQYGSFATDTLKFVNEQIALASGKTVDEVQKSIKDSSKKSFTAFELILSVGSKKTLDNIFARKDVQDATNKAKTNLSELWNALTNANVTDADSAKQGILSHVNKVLGGVTQSSKEKASAAGKEIGSQFWTSILTDTFDDSLPEKEVDNFYKKVYNAISKTNVSPIKMPIEITFVMDSVIDQVLSTFKTLSNSGMPMMSTIFEPLVTAVNALKMLNIKRYANGGMPVSGDLFFANENGKAEYISSIGNRTAVANQDQMRAEIRQGVKEGIMEAMSVRGNSDSNTYIYIDGDEIAYRIERRNDTISKRTGGR